MPDGEKRNSNQAETVFILYLYNQIGETMAGEWHLMVQAVVEEIDRCIRNHEDEKATLVSLSKKLGFSEFHVSRKFREISGMSFREYLRERSLAFTLKDVRDTKKGLLEIALEHGFSSHEAFTRSFKESYGMTPSEFRANLRPVALRTVIRPFDCFLAQTGGFKMKDENGKNSTGEIRTYFVTIPAHKYLHIRNYESIGYWDFWQRQNKIPGQDYETICGILESIPRKLDDAGGSEADSGSGQIMAFINEPTGRICSWGIPLAESYGVRLPADWNGEVPPQMQLMDVAEGEYIVFEHGPFDFETENQSVEAAMEDAMKNFDFHAAGYELDTSQGRLFYFYHDCRRFWKYVRPVKRVN